MADLKNIKIGNDIYKGVKKISVQDAASGRDLFLSESFIEDNTVGQTITKNGDVELAPSDGYYATQKVTVKVSVPGTVPSLESVSVTINKNGTTEVTPTSGKDGISKVTITTSVPTSGGVEEVATAAAMNALLVEANVGKYYKFTGPTDSNYTNGNLYLVESGQ